MASSSTNNRTDRSSRPKEDILKILFVGPRKCGKRSIIDAEILGIDCDQPRKFVSFENSFKEIKRLQDYARPQPAPAPEAGHGVVQGSTDANANGVDKERTYALELTHDYSGCDPEERMQYYAVADVIALCFSVADEKHLPAVEYELLPEILAFAPNTPIVLVGCKSDLRSQEGVYALHRSQCEMFRRQIHAVSYVECSTKASHMDISGVMYELIMQGTRYKKRKFAKIREEKKGKHSSKRSDRRPATPSLSNS